MVMPPPRFIVIGVGCVVKYGLSGGKPQVTVGTTPSEIISLDPWFGGPSPNRADTISQYQAPHDPGFAPGPTSKAVFHNQSVNVKPGWVICSYNGKRKAKLRTHGGAVTHLEMQPGTCYWIEPGPKSKKATSIKK